MNTKKITLVIIFILYLIDKHIDEIHTNYEAWIVIFLFWIVHNTSGIVEK